MQKHLLTLLAGTIVFGLSAKTDKIEYKGGSDYEFLGHSNGIIYVKETASTFALGAFPLNAIYTLLPDSLTNGFGYNSTIWEISKPIDGFLFGIQAMMPQVVETTLTMPLDGINPDVVVAQFEHEVKNRIAEARLKLMVPALMGVLSHFALHKLDPQRLALLKEQIENLVGKFLPSIFWDRDVLPKIREKQSFNGKIVDALSPNVVYGFYALSALFAVNTVQRYRLIEGLRLKIGKIASMLVTCDKLGISKRPDLIARVTAARNWAAIDSVAYGFSKSGELDNYFAQQVIGA